MKFIVAKCPNCGAKIKFKKDEKIYTCEYCKYDILFDDDGGLDKEHMKTENVDLTDLQKKILKKAPIMMFIPIIIFIVFSAVLIFIGFSLEPSISDVSTLHYNIFIDDNGVFYSNEIVVTLNNVISNMEEYDKKIEVVFNDESYTDIDEIKMLILELSNESFVEYSMLSYKDDDGYINKIVINDN